MTGVGVALLALGCGGAILAAVGLAGAGLARSAGPAGAMPPVRRYYEGGAIPPAPAPMLLDSAAAHPRDVRIPEQREARR